MIRKALLFLTKVCSIALGGCGIPETLEEVEFEKSKFGLEYIPDRSLEGYNEKYHPFFQPVGSSERKYLYKYEDGFQFYSYPKNPSILDGIDVVAVDMIPRLYDRADQTVALTTLYVDPKLVDPSSWQALTRFVNHAYSQPDPLNPLLRWLNHGYNVGKSKGDTLFISDTIFALVYSDVASLEPVYSRADGKKFLKVGIDDGIYFKDDTEERPVWGYTGRLTDSVYYYWPGREELLDEFRGYEREGVKFGSLYRAEQGQN